MLISPKRLFTVLPCILVSLSGLASSIPPNHKQLLPRALSRDVWVVAQLVDIAIYGQDGFVEFPMHTYLFVTGTPQDGALKIEIATDNNNNPYVRVKDFTAAGTSNLVSSDRTDSTVLQGRTRMTNQAFLDPDHGTGVVTDALYEDAVYRIGTSYMGNLNTCQDFVKRILARLNIPLAEETQNWFNLFDRHGVRAYGDVSQAMEVTQYVEGIDRNTNNLKGSFETPTDLCQVGTPKRAGTCSNTPIKGKEPLFAGSKTEVALNKWAASLPAEVLDVTSTDVIPSQALPADVKGSEVKVSIVRNAGGLTRYVSIGKEVLAGLGVAATVEGAVFVILDFVDHNWVGGAIGAVGLAAGVVAGFALSGPIGWIVGGAIAALFAILPGLFQSSHPPADRTDVQGIIQWKLFGDKHHTGNEKCQQGTDGVKGNNDCQALYGAGTLSMAMGMSNFDAIVFLTQFNQGYAMSIPDMAAAFYVVDETKPGDGAHKMATITCHNNKGVPSGKAGMVGGDSPKVCDKPTFAINRQLITLPYIGATADKVFRRIIPAPGGDCKLVAHPGGAVFPDYGVTFNGLPSAIACGLTASIQVQQGTTVPIGPDPSQSTDGQDGAYVAPPPETPFKALDSTGYVCLSHDTDPPFCLPPGTYQKQSGLGFEIKNVDGLTLPPDGWSLATHWEDAPQYRDPRPPGNTDHTYTDNQDPTRKSNELMSFEVDMAAIDTNRDGKASFTIKGPNDGPDPVCCLFSETQFGGNVWCVGVGGGNTLPQWTDVAQSVSCHNGGNVWLYAQSYGDTGGALVQGNVEDLSNEPYGNNHGTFSKNVKALWVLKDR